MNRYLAVTSPFFAHSDINEPQYIGPFVLWLHIPVKNCCFRFVLPLWRFALSRADLEADYIWCVDAQKEQQ